MRLNLELIVRPSSTYQSRNDTIEISQEQPEEDQHESEDRVTNDRRELYNNPRRQQQTTCGTRRGIGQAPSTATYPFHAQVDLDDADQRQDKTVDNSRGLKIKALERGNEEGVLIPCPQQHL